MVEVMKVEASLKHGRLFSNIWMIIMYIGLVAVIFIPLVTIFMLIITFTVGMDWDNDMIFSIIGANILGVILFIVFLWIIRVNNKLKQQIFLWLQDIDIIKVKAYSKKIHEVRLGFQQKQVKIQVSFNINGIACIQESAGKMLGGFNPIGYHKIFAKYSNREIDILYSPKYDEVLILKD